MGFGEAWRRRTKGKAFMPLYEHVFMARQDASTQQVEALVEQYKGIVEGAGGKIAKVEAWGLKSLTYRIQKNRKAHFTLLNIEAPPAAVAEVERQERLSEDVIRFLTIRVEEHEEGPSAMLRKSDRDDRGDRPGGRFGDRDRGPRRDFGDRPRRDFGDRPGRSDGDADVGGAE
jgi:small subunit ribosomal protein S6